MWNNYLFNGTNLHPGQRKENDMTPSDKLVKEWQAKGYKKFECDWCRCEKSLGWVAYWGNDCPECDNRLEPR